MAEQPVSFNVNTGTVIVKDDSAVYVGGCVKSDYVVCACPHLNGIGSFTAGERITEVWINSFNVIAANTAGPRVTNINSGIIRKRIIGKTKYIVLCYQAEFKI